MKRKGLSVLFLCAMVSALLAGCGENNKVLRVDESTAVIYEETTKSSQEESAETSETDETTSDTVVEEQEIEKPDGNGDFLSRNGLVITPQGEMDLNLTLWNSDIVESMKSKITVTTIDSDDIGYADTTAVFEITVGENGYSAYLTAFDRYTGTDFESHYANYEWENSITDNSDVCVFDVDGKQYDCRFAFTMNSYDDIVKFTITIHHPKEYDGAVFQIGTRTPKQAKVSSAIDYSVIYTVDQYPELLEGQYFFTASDK